MFESKDFFRTIKYQRKLFFEPKPICGKDPFFLADNKNDGQRYQVVSHIIQS